ncbi:unnamed protein product [Clonostachys rosea f. rosea IK726]|jgi:ankyrin repeat protein|uniref:Uncharacterized protein n=1 Tax=Clonostachys rosea f. rosea IK726 TaxID=1349383 RepID=A0ACA9TYQ6_BIOOC|nr:unnamed protein product [Clonostachys rosea f. rosea IK726]
MISTVLLSNEESFEYPPIPATAKGQTRIQCPFCSDELELGSDPSKAWKDHIHHDIMSYPCLHPKCADAFTFFATPTEWKAHMQTRHDSNWVYEVSPNWYCNIDHEPQTFNTELEWRQHMTDTNGHDFIQAYFEILVDDMNETVPYSKFLCPLCKKYPENTEHLLGKDNTSPELISNLLLDHIVSHLESLSSKALPSLQHPDYITGLPSGKKAIYGALSPDEIGQFSVRRGNIVGTEYDHQQCLFCGTNALSGAISPHTVRRLLPPGAISRGLVYGYLKACLGCVQKLMRRADRPLGDFDRRTLHGNKSPDYGHVKVTADEIDRISFNLWVSWQERPECSGYRTMDPILVDLASHSAFTNLRQPFSQVLYPKARSPNFTRDSSLKIMADAVRTGNVQAACWLIDNGSSVDMIDQHGMSPLLWAAVLGHEEMVQLLLKKKAKIEIRDTFNRTPLSLAALGDHKGIVDLLLRSGANVDSYDSSDLTSLFWAVVAGRISVVQSLLAFGARYQDADQFFSMPYSRDEESGDGKYSSRTAFRPMSLIDSTKMECITSAIEKGDEKAVHELIDQVHGIHGFNIDSKKTILDFAIEAGNWPITLSLLQYDAERLQPGSVARARRLVEANKRMVEASSVVD